MANIESLDSVIQVVDNHTKKLENFLTAQSNVAADFQRSTKLLYDLTKIESKRKTAALPELVIQDFDEEQIWQQLEIQNEAELTNFLTGVSRILAGNEKLSLNVALSKADPETLKDTSAPEDDSESENEEVEPQDMPSDASDSDEMDVDIDVDGNFPKKQSKPAKRPIKPSIVDDRFFKLEELDEYLTKEDKKTLKEDSNSDDSDGSEEPVDLFNDDSGLEEDDDDDAKMVKYAGFFDSPEETADSFHQSNDEDFVDETEPSNKRKTEEAEGNREKRVKFNLTNDDDDSEADEEAQEDDGPSADDGHADLTSTLEARQDRLQKKIKQLEAEALSEKPWQLRGEVTASSRPQNSLLEEFVEFDITSRPAPVITEQTSLKLEDIIQQRIKDKAWDDVERKFKPVETPLEYKKKLVMDQEKSQKSLAQIYEDAYLKQKEAAKGDVEEKEEEEPKQHKEIRGLMHSLMTKLDALCNFHYTPKSAQPEIRIISNIPAINMEEVAPVATSDATLLAPEEVKDKPHGDVIGKSERTKTDVKRARRKKKFAQHERQVAGERKKKTLADVVDTQKNKLKKKSSKVAQTLEIKKLTKDRNISTIAESSQRVPKSSTAFFTQLQDQVSNHIKLKTGKAINKKAKATHSAIKLKL